MNLRKAAEMALEAMEKYCECGGLEDPIEELRQALAHQPEPIAWMVYSVDGQSVCITDDPTSFSDEQRALPLWPGPFEREWVGLTDEEIDDAVKSCNTIDTYKYFRAVEAKLKEKNT